VIFDSEGPFIHPAERERSEVYVPQSIADFFQADVFARERLRDADPISARTCRTSSTRSSTSTKRAHWSRWRHGRSTKPPICRDVSVGAVAMFDIA